MVKYKPTDALSLESEWWEKLKIDAGREMISFMMGDEPENQTGLTQMKSNTFESDPMRKLGAQFGMFVEGNAPKVPDFFRMLLKDKITTEREDPSGMGKKLLGDAKKRGGKMIFF